jgi:hypothetical protein
MENTTQTNEFPIAHWFRGMGRASAIVLFVTWLGLLVAELTRDVSRNPAADAFFQAAVLAVVFAGYAIGWRHEFFGGLIAILGTVAFFVVDAFTLPMVGGLGAAALFAVPGVFYLLAWCFDREPAKHLWRLI